MTILITGFNRYDNIVLNPTEMMMDDIQTSLRSSHDCQILTEVLPTEFEKAGQRIVELISSIAPDALLLFGLKPDSPALCLERFALNIDDSSTPDNAGHAPAGVPIISEGPLAYPSTLPLEDLRRGLLAAGIPVVYSNHAGAYVCNHVFYLACHHSATSSSQRMCGFIHVPMALPPLPQGPHEPILLLAHAVAICVDVIQNCLCGKNQD